MTRPPYIGPRLWAVLWELSEPLWQIPDDPFHTAAWTNPFLPPDPFGANPSLPPVAIPDIPHDDSLRIRYTPDDALPTGLLEYRTIGQYPTRV